MSTDDKADLRAQLDEAIAKVRHQIEIQQTSNQFVGAGHINADAIGELEAELVQLEQARTDLNR